MTKRARNLTSSIFARKAIRNAQIGIVGLGYVGLPLSLAYTEVGYKVLGLDIDKSKTDAINKGLSYIKHIPCERMRMH